ncbi:hypothetical protein [Emticicia sp. BO119]|uniref:hypothetical protein n=1 Tax=Emticicia sp. BO119 TaxID=2757768 RepID=UPI0015F049C9|nr:hypothetical protein [Emticicia sp. BO119]MBA4849478.1 hypothetical protein [Emticicia sp. BO119]
MTFKEKILDKVFNTATDKVTSVAENLVNKGIDQAAANVATNLGLQFAKPAPYTNQQIIESYRSQRPAEQYEQVQQQVPQQPVQQPMQQFSNPFLNPNFGQVQLAFEPQVINRLDEVQVERLAKYKTQMFFQINNIGKNAIRFLGQKFFSYNLEQSKQIVEEYEAGRFDDEKAYKKAKYKIEKVEQLENMKDDAEQEKLFRDFVADVILDELKKKNERGELQMPTMWDIALQQFGFHTWAVFSPDLTLESYLGV